MKKIYVTLLCAFCAIYSYGQEWNFSDAEFTGLIAEGSTSVDIVENQTISGLTFHCTAEKDITLQENSKSIDGYEFTHRLKFNGSGTWDDDNVTTVGRILSFSVDGPKLITVYGMTSSSSSERNLLFTVDGKQTEIGRFTHVGGDIGKYEFNYTGEANTIYVFSESSGFNIYALKVATATAIDDVKVLKEVIKTQYYSINGVLVSTSYDVLPKGIYIKQDLFEDGTSKTTKVSKTSAW
ncbi:hypothetical protein [Carboxylicivirga linearis]|uniref:Lipocalin-like domain-containing protein n=1 Tax=Carboxylicivirga linearis TaxID=1628157 RepID=A0ABS5JUA3_9BACT|nr:hypothetical protein [Carboxylicivirga linearis]MBS2098428.1 hypothetical protein [Carboxylicivirga linearis]